MDFGTPVIEAAFRHLHMFLYKLPKSTTMSIVHQERKVYENMLVSE